MSNSNKIRYIQRLESFESAIAQLNRASKQEQFSELERAGLVQMYEFTFELAWKTLQDLLFVEGITANSPRQTIRESYKTGYIDNVDVWLEALESRNRLAHTYNEETAQEAQELIQNRYAPILNKIFHKLQQQRDK